MTKSAIKTPASEPPTSGRREPGQPLGKNVARLRSLAAECNFDAHALSRELRVSTRQLGRHFKLALGCSPQRWLNEQRVLAARRMLASASSVKEVAYQLGFSQVSQFCRDYRARFGRPPSSDLKSAEWYRAAPCTAPRSDHSCRGQRAGAPCALVSQQNDDAQALEPLRLNNFSRVPTAE